MPRLARWCGAAGIGALGACGAFLETNSEGVAAAVVLAALGGLLLGVALAVALRDSHGVQSD